MAVNSLNPRENRALHLCAALFFIASPLLIMLILSALAGQNMQAAALRQQAIERELRRTRESQSVLLSARTPQNTPAGLTGAYEQTLSVAGLAAAPTQRSMAEISRFFERDARRYG